MSHQMVFKKGDLWSNSFIMLMKDHYGVKCIMNGTDVLKWKTKEQWVIVISDIYCIVTKTIGIVLKCN